MPGLTELIRHRFALFGIQTIASLGRDLAGQDAGNAVILACFRRILFPPSQCGPMSGTSLVRLDEFFGARTPPEYTYILFPKLAEHGPRPHWRDFGEAVSILANRKGVSEVRIVISDDGPLCRKPAVIGFAIQTSLEPSELGEWRSPPNYDGFFSDASDEIRNPFTGGADGERVLQIVWN